MLLLTVPFDGLAVYSLGIGNLRMKSSYNESILRKHLAAISEAVR